MSTSSYLKDSQLSSQILYKLTMLIRMIVNNTQHEIKQLTVAQFATKADTQEEKDLLRVIKSLKHMIPKIMDFPIVRQQFVFKSTVSF